MHLLGFLKKCVLWIFLAIGIVARGLTLSVILLLALAVAGIFFLPRLFNSERMREILVTEIEEMVHRPVQLQGVIVSLQGIKLQGVKIIDKTDPGRCLVESGMAVMTVKLPALLRRRLEFNSVRLVAPHIYLERNAQGLWNFADLFASSAAAHAVSPGRLFLPVSMAARRIIIEEGVLHVDDHLRQSSYHVEKLNLIVHKFDIERPFTFSASFDNLNRIQKREIKTSLSMEGSMSLASFDWFEAYLEAQTMELKVDGHVIRGSGRLMGFPQTTLNLDVAVPALGPEQWGRYFQKNVDFFLPASHWRVKMEFLEPRQIHLEYLRVDAASLSVRGSGVVDRRQPYGRIEAKLDLKEFLLKDASSFRRALVPYELEGFAQGEVRLSGGIDRLVIHEINLGLKEAQARLGPDRVIRGELELKAWDDFSRVSLAVSKGALSAFSNTFTDISLSLNLRKKDLKIDALSLKWDDSSLRLKGRVLNMLDPREVSVSGSLDHLRWENVEKCSSEILAYISTRPASAEGPGFDASKKSWVEAFKYSIPRKFPDTIGRIHIGEVTHKNFSFKNADLLWSLRGVTPSLKKVSGDLRAGFGPGRVNDIQAVQNSSKFLKIVFLPYIYMHKMNNLSVLSAKTAYPKVLDFNRIEGQYGVHEGVVTTRFFHVDSPQLVAYADGTADFAKETVDMNILTRLTSYRAPLPEWWVDELGRPAIGFRVKGDLNKPDLEPRLKKMASDEIEKALEEGRSRAKARIEAIEKLERL